MYGYRAGEATSLENLGSVSEDQGNPSAALDDYLTAISLEESIRESARIEEFKTLLAEQTVDVYQRAILLERRMGKNREAFELSERARARTLLDQLGNARIDPRGSADPQVREKERALRLNIEGNELRLKQQRMKPDSGESIGIVEKKLADEQGQYMVILNNLKAADPEYASLRSVDVLKLTDVQKLLEIRKDTTLLSYWVTEDKTLVFLITSDSFQTIELPVKKDALIKAIQWFRSFDDTNEIYPESLKRLYGWLIAPIGDSIKTSKVGIIPHGVLHYVPFSALTDGRDYFGEKYTLFNLPSASVLPYILNKNRPKGRAMLALAESRAEGLPVLEKADNEATLIAQIYGTQALVTPNATKSTLRNRARECTILHIAAHAELNPNNPLFSRIYLAPDKDDSGMLDVGEVYELDLRRANLVVLSACETELGAQSSGDDVVGMNRAFLYAGTPTVISSLWTVDDQSTGLLMESFYKHLKSGMSKAAALQAAQRELRAKYPNPFYWAPFVLTGDPE